jgi:hypothetical protein
MTDTQVAKNFQAEKLRAEATRDEFAELNNTWDEYDWCERPSKKTKVLCVVLPEVPAPAPALEPEFAALVVNIRGAMNERKRRREAFKMDPPPKAPAAPNPGAGGAAAAHVVRVEEEVIDLCSDSEEKVIDLCFDSEEEVIDLCSDSE